MRKCCGCNATFFCWKSVNLKKHLYNFNIKLPHLILDGRYVVDGRILLIPIRGKGKLTGDICKTFIIASYSPYFSIIYCMMLDSFIDL